MPLSLGLGFLFFCFFAKSCDPKSTPLQKQKQKQTNKKNTGKKQSQLPCRPESSNLNKAARIPLSGGEGESERPPHSKGVRGWGTWPTFSPTSWLWQRIPSVWTPKDQLLKTQSTGKKNGQGESYFSSSLVQLRLPTFLAQQRWRPDFGQRNLHLHWHQIHTWTWNSFQNYNQQENIN